MGRGHSIQTPTCPLPLLTTSLLLVASLGGLHNRLLERLDGHTEDAHGSESTTETQTTRKRSVPGPRVCCRMRPLAHVIAPGFVTPLVLPLGFVWLYTCSPAARHCCSSSPCPTTAYACSLFSCHPASQPSEGEQAVLGGGSWLADQLPRDLCWSSELGPVQPSWLLALLTH